MLVKCQISERPCICARAINFASASTIFRLNIGTFTERIVSFVFHFEFNTLPVIYNCQKIASEMSWQTPIWHWDFHVKCQVFRICVPYFISLTKLHVSQLSGIQPRPLLVIGNDSKGRYKSKYYTNIITMVPSLHIENCIEDGPCLI